MSEEAVINELKEKGLPTFGVKAVRLERLKKHYGIININNNNINQDNSDIIEDQPKLAKNNNKAKDKVVSEIERINEKREERRAKLQKVKDDKIKKNDENKALGYQCDVDFELMIAKERFKEHMLTKHVESSKMKLCVNIRKRPLFTKEIKNGNFNFFKKYNL